MKTVLIESIEKGLTILNGEEEILDYIKTNIDFFVKDKYLCDSEPRTFLETLCKERSVNLIYTDENKNFIKGKKSTFQNVMSTSFFKKHKDKIFEIIRYNLLNNPPSSFVFENPLYEPSFIKIVKTSPCENFTFVNIDLNEEELKTLKASKKNIYIKKNNEHTQLAYINVFDGVKFSQIEQKKQIILNVPISDRHIYNLKYLNPECDIALRTFANSLSNKSEADYYAELRKITKRLKELGFENKVNIEVDDKNLFNEEYLSYNIDYSNLIIRVKSNSDDLPLEEYIKIEDKLNKLIPNLDGLSPFEKYLKIYNVVKHFKKYNKSVNTDESRYLNHIINNDYIVCVGFSVLLIDLLRKSGINACKYSNMLARTNDEEKNENSNYFMEDHSRTLVNLVDEKYGVDGFYVVDSTWDNDLENDSYNYAVGTIDAMQKHHSLMSLSDIDYFFDVTDFDNFVLKVNQLLKHSFSKSIFSCKNEKDKLFKIMSSELKKILKVIQALDPEKYFEFRILLDEIDKEYSKNFLKPDFNLNPLLKKMDEVYTKVGHYCVSKNNNKISNEVLAKGVLNIGNISHDQIDTFLKDFEKHQEIRYPDLFKEDTRGR